MSTFWTVVLIFFAVVLAIGLLRVLFDRRHRTDISDVILDILLIDLVFDLMDAVGNGISDVGSDLDAFDF